MKLQEIHNQRILISPLNWGMGHVSRCIGLIHSLVQQENTIIIACNKEQRIVFENYFKNVEYIDHAGYPFKFRGKGRFSLDLTLQWGKLKKRLKQELSEVEVYVNKNNIDLVISDHRYGFRSVHVPSIFLTHQLSLPVMWHEFFIQGVHRRLLKKFEKIWVLDYSDHRLAGRLSNNDALLNVEFIGPFSRFQWYDFDVEKVFEKVIVISGPRIYGQQLVNEFTLDELSPTTVFIVNEDIEVPDGVNAIKGDWLEKDAIIRAAKCLVTRSGYSSIMDVIYLKCDADLIPTPGQREQEYLFELHQSKKERFSRE